MTPYPAISGNDELQVLKQVRLLKGPVKANFSHVVGFVVVDQELLLRCPVMAVLKKQTYDEHQEPRENCSALSFFRNYSVLLSGPGSIIVYVYHSPD